MAAVATLAIALGGYEAYHRQQWNHRGESAEALFYSIKSLDVKLADVERKLLASTYFD